MPKIEGEVPVSAISPTGIRHIREIVEQGKEVLEAEPVPDHIPSGRDEDRHREVVMPTAGPLEPYIRSLALRQGGAIFPAQPVDLDEIWA